MQHIREAEELSRELGGTDKDVKDYFFRLAPQQLARVLDLYGQKYGDDARDYAIATIGRWRTGNIKMAGQTATRLFNLLPPLMPLQDKYRLTESLWRHVGPTSKRLLRVGLDATVDGAVTKVREHIEAVVSGYQIPGTLAQRFEWLSAGDVSVKQDLLNHLQGLEKQLVVEAARQQLPVMLEHLRADRANHTKHLAQTLRVGKHELEIRVDRVVSGVHLEEWRPHGFAASSMGKWIWWVLGLAALIAFVATRGHH